MNYRLDCGYIITDGQRLRPYCSKLTREIRPRDCSGCGWFYLPPESLEDKELGLGAMVEEDVKRMKREVEQ